jgi:pimeloyl-ACP methyl ester carboxylesterase
MGRGGTVVSTELADEEDTLGTFEHVEVQAHTLVLADGRRLAWREYGHPDGVPCMYTTGTPASSLAGALHHDAARRAGVRWISLDKPGYGWSDFQPNRRLLDWPDDISALAGELGLSRFAVAGESGGGPHALALAYALTDAITTAVVLAGMGPGDQAWVRQGMKRQNRVMFGIAQRAPWAMLPPTALTGWLIKSPRRAERFMRKQAAASPPADQELFTDPRLTDVFLAATRDAFRSGARGAAQELTMLARPWRFDLADIRTHVDLWHGTEDVNVPVAIARAVAAKLPDCDARIVDGAGHGVAWTRLDEIMKVIVTAA